MADTRTGQIIFLWWCKAHKHGLFRLRCVKLIILLGKGQDNNMRCKGKVSLYVNNHRSVVTLLWGSGVTYHCTFLTSAPRGEVSQLQLHTHGTRGHLYAFNRRLVRAQNRSGRGDQHHCRQSNPSPLARSQVTALSKLLCVLLKVLYLVNQALPLGSQPCALGRTPTPTRTTKLILVDKLTRAARK